MRGLILHRVVPRDQLADRPCKAHGEGSALDSLLNKDNCTSNLSAEGRLLSNDYAAIDWLNGLAGVEDILG